MKATCLRRISRQLYIEIMVKLFFIILFSFDVFFINAQNLVPNWSFEDTIKCVNTEDEFNGYVADWKGQGGGGGLCYLTSQCSGAILINVPSNEFGFQYAHTGVSYAGIYTFVCDTCYQGYPSDTSYYNFRNYIEAKLTSPLTNSTKYYITFYVSLGDKFNYACNDIGAYLSDSALKFDTTKIGRVKDYIIPQIANNPIANPLTDTLNWQKVTGIYIANGGEQYIIIGNFKNDSNSHFHLMGLPGGNITAAYYYIDDVFVTTDSALADASELTVESEKIKVYPNPASTMLNIEVQNNSEQDNFCLYNDFGQLVECTRMNNNFNTVSVSNLPAGLYYYRITDENGKLIKADKVAVIH